MSRREIIADGVELYLGDCREIAATLSFDAVISDPPYGINHKVERTGIPAGHKRRTNERIVGDIGPFDPSPWAQCPAVLWGANYYAQLLPVSGGWLVFDKRRGGTHNQAFKASDCELAWTNLFGSVKMFSHLWAGVCRESEIGQHHHPMQKPIALMEWCIGFLPERAQTVLDPYMGSGTTGVAAALLGRKFTGIEIEPKYFDIACRRIEKVTSQHDMFAHRVTPAEAKP